MLWILHVPVEEMSLGEKVRRKIKGKIYREVMVLWVPPETDRARLKLLMPPDKRAPSCHASQPVPLGANLRALVAARQCVPAPRRSSSPTHAAASEELRIRILQPQKSPHADNA